MLIKKITLSYRLILMVLLVLTFLAIGCKQDSGGIKPSINTLKIGAINWLGWPPGLGAAHGQEIMVNMANQEGGLIIGGEKYDIELISYDTNNNQATAVAAVNRLVFEDEVKFIISDGNYIEAWLPITNDNKVIVSTAAATPEVLNPLNKYCFQTGFVNCNTCLINAWAVNNNPDFKTFASAAPDSEAGHNVDAVIQKVFAAANRSKDLTGYWYPPAAQDLSSLATKIRNTNPDVFQCHSGKDDLGVFKQIRAAGYEGHLLGGQPSSILKIVLTPEEAEGFIGSTTACGFDPPQTELGKRFAQAFIAAYPKEAYSIASQFASTWSALRAAIVKANSIDVDKVAAAFTDLRFETPAGTGQMVSRPDMGNSRSVDSVLDFYFYGIENGEEKMLDHLSIEDALKYFKQVFK